MKNKNFKKHKWLFWLGLISVFVFLISPFLLYRFHNRAKFNRIVNNLSAAGFPISPDEVVAGFVFPEGVQNAADTYLQAFAAYIEPNELELELLPIRGKYTLRDNEISYPPEVINTIADILQKNTESLKLLEDAAQIPFCLYPFEKKGAYISQGHLGPIKKAANLLAEQNIYYIQNGNKKQFLESLPTLISLVNSASSQPSTIQYLVSISSRSIIIKNIQFALNHLNFTDAQLVQLQQTLKKLRQIMPELYKKALINERAEGISYANLSPVQLCEILMYNSDIKAQSLWGLYWASGMAEKDFIINMETYQKMIDLTQLPYWQQSFELDKLISILGTYNGFHFILNSGATLIGQLGMRQISASLCAETALAVERYRLKYAKLPESLTDLVPEFIDEVPIDPFDGNPLRYKLRETGGYTIYSICEDKIDNNGLTQKQSTSKQFDLPFTVNR